MDQRAAVRTRDRRRADILAVAREVFLSEGFADASMSTISARIGGSKATLYNYFSSKQDLFEGVIREYCSTSQIRLFDALPIEGEDVATVLYEFGCRYVALVLSDDVIRLSRLVIAESVRFPELGRALYDAGPRRSSERLADYLDQQIERRRLQHPNVRRLVDQFCQMCLTDLYRKRLMNAAGAPDAIYVDEIVRDAVAIIMLSLGLADRDRDLIGVDSR